LNVALSGGTFGRTDSVSAAKAVPATTEPLADAKAITAIEEQLTSLSNVLRNATIDVPKKKKEQIEDALIPIDQLIGRLDVLKTQQQHSFLEIFGWCGLAGGFGALLNMCIRAYYIRGLLEAQQTKLQYSARTAAKITENLALDWRQRAHSSSESQLTGDYRMDEIIREREALYIAHLRKRRVAARAKLALIEESLSALNEPTEKSEQRSKDRARAIGIGIVVGLMVPGALLLAPSWLEAAKQPDSVLVLVGLVSGCVIAGMIGIPIITFILFSGARVLGGRGNDIIEALRLDGGGHKDHVVRTDVP
jgi:hypothetical protein